jgi:NTE family protein
VLDDFDATSRLNAAWEFFLLLRDAGRRKTRKWLKANYDAIGVRSTLDLKAAVS